MMAPEILPMPWTELVNESDKAAWSMTVTNTLGGGIGHLEHIQSTGLSPLPAPAHSSSTDTTASAKNVVVSIHL